MSADPTAAALLRRARSLVVFTGAGVSAESGIPTFRDALTGLWERFDAAELATPQAFRRDPELVWGWYEWRRALVRHCRPNAAHHAIAEIQRRVGSSYLITQNVDDLHERAGSTNVIRLHGSLFAPRCSACTAPADPPDVKPASETSVTPASGTSFTPASGTDATPASGTAPQSGGARVAPPHCPRCGSLIRPGVVWFGEPLPESALGQATAAAESCDVFLAVGTSGLVHPAADLPYAAHRHGAAVIQINLDRTSLDRIAAVNIHARAGEVLPALVASAWPGGSTEPEAGYL